MSSKKDIDAYSCIYNPATEKYERIEPQEKEYINIETLPRNTDGNTVSEDDLNFDLEDSDMTEDTGVNDDFDINWYRRHLPEHWHTAGKTINAYRINPNFEDQFFGDDPMIEIIRAIEELAHQSLSASISTPPEALTLHKSMIETPYTWTFFEDVMQYHSRLDDNKFLVAKEHLYKTGHIARISMTYKLPRRFVLTTRPISVQHYKKGARSLI